MKFNGCWARIVNTHVLEGGNGGFGVRKIAELVKNSVGFVL